MKDVQKQTIDKSWNAMRQILDHEMPVEKKKRRFAWWWLLVLLIPIAVWGGRQYWNKPTSSTPEMPQSSPVPMTERVPSNVPAVISDDEASVALPPDNQPSVPLHRVVTYETKSNLISFQSESVNEGYSEAKNHVQQTENLTINNQTIHQYPEATTFVKFESFELSPLVAPQHLLVASRTLPVIPTLPTMVKVSKKGRPIQLGAGIAASTDQFNAVNTLSGGFRMKRSLGKRWDVNTGLSYTDYRPSMAIQPLTVVQAEAYKDATDQEFTIEDLGGNLIPSPSSLDQTVLIPVNRLRMIEIPAYANWKAYRNFSILGGFSAAYLLSVNSAKSSFSGELKLEPTTTDARNTISQLAADKLDRWQFNALVGMEYRFGKHLQLNMVIRQPMNDVLNASSKVESLNGNGYLDIQGIVSKTSATTPWLSLGINYLW